MHLLCLLGAVRGPGRQLLVCPRPVQAHHHHRAPLHTGNGSVFTDDRAPTTRAQRKRPRMAGNWCSRAMLWDWCLAHWPKVSKGSGGGNGRQRLAVDKGLNGRPLVLRSTCVHSLRLREERNQRDGMRTDQTGLAHLFGAAPVWRSAARTGPASGRSTWLCSSGPIPRNPRPGP